MSTILKILIGDVQNDKQIRKELIFWLVVLIVGAVLGVLLGTLLYYWMRPDIPEGTLYCKIDTDVHCVIV